MQAPARSRRSGRPRGGAGGPAAAQPLGDLSNSAGRAPPPAKPQKPAAASPPPPQSAAAAAAAAQPSPLPGLEEDCLPLPVHGHGTLPVASSDAEGFSAFGSALNCLRVTSLSRSAAARSKSALRLVAQPDAALGRASARLEPQQRVALRPRTHALVEEGAPRPASGPRSRSKSGGRQAPAVAPQAEADDACPAGPKQAPPQQAAAEDAASEPVSEAPSASSAASPVAPAPAADSEPASEGTGALPPPLPVVPGAGRADSNEGAEAEEPPPAADGPAAGDAQAAAYCGPSAEEEAAALPSAPSMPAWLAQERCRNESGSRLAPAAPLALPGSAQAAAMWRMQWLSALQWHNACRAGQPVRAGACWPFIPLDPNDTVLEVLIRSSAVMPEHVVAGAARFQDIVLSDEGLHRQAVEAGVLLCGQWGVAGADGTLKLVAGGAPLALPMRPCEAPPQLLSFFLACVWREANSCEAAQAQAHTFGAGGQRVASERYLKYKLEELHAWVRLALGGSAAEAAEASLAGLAAIATFGLE